MINSSSTHSNNQHLQEIIVYIFFTAFLFS